MACFRSAAVIDLAFCAKDLIDFVSSIVEDLLESRSWGPRGVEGRESFPLKEGGLVTSMVDVLDGAAELSMDAFEGFLAGRPFCIASAIADSFGGEELSCCSEGEPLLADRSFRNAAASRLGVASGSALRSSLSILLVVTAGSATLAKEGARIILGARVEIGGVLSPSDATGVSPPGNEAIDLLSADLL